MADNIMEKRMFYSYKEGPAWHALGFHDDRESKAEEVLNCQFGGGFTTRLGIPTVFINGEDTELETMFIIRSKTNLPDSKEVVFGTCTERYTPLQPYQIAQVFDEKVGKPVETMGFLGLGQEMFISWKQPGFEVGKGDEVNLYGIGKFGFNALLGNKLFTATVRPVCQNTLVLAQNWAANNTDGKGRGNIWDGKHNNKNLLRDFGYWAEFVVANAEREANETKEFFNALANTPVKNDEEVKEILWYAFPDTDSLGAYYPPQLRGAREAAITGDNNKQANIRAAILQVFQGGTAITPNLWGVLNATTEFYNHFMPSKKPTASSIVFDNRQKDMMNVVNVLKDRVMA